MREKCRVSWGNQSNDKLFTLYIRVSVEVITFMQRAGFNSPIPGLDLLGSSTNIVFTCGKS
jgi:hypothetical protein